jgi:hypothetical protein
MTIVKVTPEPVAKAIGATDAEIARNVAGDPDAAPLLTDDQTAPARRASGGNLQLFSTPMRRPITRH